jgi:alpha-glucosidase
MDIRTALKLIRIIGLREAFQAVHYSLRRTWLERGRQAPPAAPVAPGELLEANPQPSGAHFRFAQAGLEVQFLAPDLVRLTWEPGQLPVPYAIARSEWPEVAITMRPAGPGWTLASAELQVTVQADGSIRFADAAGRTLREELAPEQQGEAWAHSAPLQPEERLYGLGERAAPFNLRRGSYRLWNRDPGGAYGPGADPLYLGIPVYLGLHGQGSYLVFYENSYPGRLTLEDTAAARFAGGALRYYFIPGPPARAVERYSELTGRPPLPPRWALGYHQSRWSYASEADVRAVAAGFREHDLPLSAIHLDIDYLDGYRVFTVDRQRFPDLAGLAGELAEEGIRLVAILDCGVRRDRHYDLFREGLAEGLFCTLAGGRPAYGPVWPGWCAYPDFTDPRARAWWGRQYRWLLEAGIAGFWHDMNEPAVSAAWGEMTLPLTTCHALEGRRGDHREAHNLYGLLMGRAGYEALRQWQPERRPWIFSRSGWAGLARYAWNWTGDIATSWETLRQTVATVLGLGLSGVPYSGPDVGGFSGAPSAELYTRWLQMAAFLPFFRTHSMRTTPRREPWSFGEPTLGIARAFLRLRYRLMPYLYTLAWEAAQTGHPLVRPLFWPDGADPALWDVDDAFLLGQVLLVAPVVAEGATSRAVPLPRGRWYSFWDEALAEGPGEVVLDAPLERIPLLVRAGSVLPMEEEDRLVLHLYPPAPGQEGGGLLYSDAGDGYAAGRVDRFHLAWEGRQLVLTRTGEGEYPFPYPGIELHLRGLKARRAWMDSVELDWPGRALQIGLFRQVRIEVSPVS